MPPQNSPVAISVVRNEIGRLGQFLDHYRRLGIERFIIVDNGSTDGGQEYLCGQPDVDVYSAEEHFHWRRKHGWISRLIEEYGRDRWYLLADADEHVVFSECEARGFPDLAERLSAVGRRRARGCLVDMYSDRAILAAARPPEVTLREAFPYFDPGGYPEHRNALLVSRTGGPRRRVFSVIDATFEPQLTKYPLFRLAEAEIVASPHYIWPAVPDASDPCFLGILHYKFDDMPLLRITEAVRTRQYWRHSAEYIVYQQALRRNPLLTFYWNASRRYVSSADLVSCGLIETIPWARAEGFYELVRVAARNRRAARLRLEYTAQASDELR